MFGSVRPGGTSSVSRVRTRAKSLRPKVPSADAASGELPHRACFRHGEELPLRSNTEHRLAIDITFFAERNKVIEQRARDFRPQVAPHMQVRLQSARFRLNF